MKSIMLASLLLVILSMGCRKTTESIPADARSMMQGEWTLMKVKAKTWIGKVRVGGQKQKLHIDVTLIVDGDDYSLIDEEGTVQLAGHYEIKEDSILLFNAADSTEAPERFRLHKLSRNEMEMLTTQQAPTRLGDSHTEGVYYYER